MAANKIGQIRVDGNIAYIPLSKGYEAVIDAADVHLVSGMTWYAKVTPHTIYAVSKPWRSKAVYMHRLFFADCAEMIDHADGNGINNRRINLRPATPRENQYNKSVSKSSISGAKGVSACPRTNLWRARIKKDGKEIMLGTFDTIADASVAYRKASEIFHSVFARL